MKRNYVFILTVVFFNYLLGQEENKKNNINLFPEQGDIAIGVDATPFINLIGNLIKINSGTIFNDPSSWQFLDNLNALYAKYYLQDDMAIRGKFNFGLASTSNREYVKQDGQNDPLVTVEDKMVRSQTNIILGAGLEKRRGKSRIHGFYGAETQLLLASMRDKFSYGNRIQNGLATFYDFYNDVAVVSDERILERKYGTSFGFGIRAFIGIEFFMFSKMCVGGEFGWGLNLVTTSDGEESIEKWDNANNTIRQLTRKIGGESTFGFNLDNFGGNIYILFHF